MFGKLQKASTIAVRNMPDPLLDDVGLNIDE